MSGHSKWHSIKHKKGAADAKRGREFTKVIREITVAARMGGSDPESNSRLRLAIAQAKGVNMPADNVKRAVLRGTGELPGQVVEEYIYEGFGPGGTAVMVEVITDNKNRAVADIRHIFAKAGGNLGPGGSVAWMFAKKGMIELDAEKVDEEKVFELAVEAGAEDVVSESGIVRVQTDPSDFEAVRNALETGGLEIVESRISLIPNTTQKLEGKTAEQMLRLMEKLEEHDDVQNVYANFDIDDSVIEAMS